LTSKICIGTVSALCVGVANRKYVLLSATLQLGHVLENAKYCKYNVKALDSKTTYSSDIHNTSQNIEGKATMNLLL